MTVARRHAWYDRSPKVEVPTTSATSLQVAQAVFAQRRRCQQGEHERVLVGPGADVRFGVKRLAVGAPYCAACGKPLGSG